MTYTTNKNCVNCGGEGTILANPCPSCCGMGTASIQQQLEELLQYVNELEQHIVSLEYRTSRTLDLLERLTDCVNTNTNMLMRLK